MAWNTVTWSTGDPITAAKLNAMSDNGEYLSAEIDGPTILQAMGTILGGSPQLRLRIEIGPFTWLSEWISASTYVPIVGEAFKDLYGLSTDRIYQVIVKVDRGTPSSWSTSNPVATSFFRASALWRYMTVFGSAKVGLIASITIALSASNSSFTGAGIGVAWADGEWGTEEKFDRMQGGLDIVREEARARTILREHLAFDLGHPNSTPPGPFTWAQVVFDLGTHTWYSNWYELGVDPEDSEAVGPVPWRGLRGEQRNLDISDLTPGTLYDFAISTRYGYYSGTPVYTIADGATGSFFMLEDMAYAQIFAETKYSHAINVEMRGLTVIATRHDEPW